MQINNECIRDILFVIEKKADFEHGCHMMGAYRKYPELEKYGGNGVIPYHVRYLKMKDMIFNPDPALKDSYDLTPAGHEFIANVREENNWKKIKSVSSSIGFASLKVVSAIAEGVATAAINKQLGFSE